ncbi:hypothetical protein NOF55_10040 [Rhizobiaceae bacterium BDR2-2]|uniref:Uncharacterized protein n=1 Tax=Ectorhizobium quercum TaxID=2965071 RepID=A0AAE3SV81_9HYPH|nr:hypothetical protein [Ectorhizobium quercum]MCX8997448.1 hypothetical protein [Ectorhizobium quercum]
MSPFRGLLATVLISLISCALAHAGDDARALTGSGKAWATVRKAVRQGDTVRIELRFETDYAGYSGEIVYEKLPDDAIDGAIYLSSGGERFLLRRENGKVAAPGELRLKFNYAPEKNPRVGDWKAAFAAPPADAADIMLVLPNVAPIGPIAIKAQ